MAQQVMQDDAGNLWYVDASGNPTGFAGRADAPQTPQPMTVGRPDPRAAYEGPLAAAQLAKAQADLDNMNKPPEGYRRTANGNLEPIPGGPADPKNKGRSGEEASRDETRVANLRALERQIAEVRRLYAAGPGKTKGLTGLRDYLPSDANREFDTASAALADIGNAAFKVPGMGAQSDADAARFVAANQPSSGDRDVQIEQKLGALERRLAEAYKAAGVQPLGLVPTLAPKGPDQTIAGKDKFTASAEGSALATQLVRMGRTDEQINAALEAAGLDRLDVNSIGQVREYLRQNPNFQGVIPGVGKTQPTTGTERFLASPTGAGAMSYLDAASAGLTSQMVGQEGRNALQMNQDANPVASMVGGGLGSLTSMAAGGAALRGSALATRMAANPRAAALGGDLAYGSTFGFNTANEGEGAQGALFGAAGSLAGNFLGQGVGKAAGATMRGVVDPSVAYLRSRGVPLTGGQMLGGVVKGVEDRLSGFAGLGDLVNNGRREGLNAFGQAAFDDAGQSIGFKPTRTGAAGIDDLRAAAGQAYNQATAGVAVPVDPQFNVDLAAARAMGQRLPPDLSGKFDLAIANRVDPATQAGLLTGDAYQQAVRGLKSYKAEAPGSGFEGDYRDALSAAQDALRGNMMRGGGQQVVDGLNAADQAYKLTSVLQDAVKRARNGSRSGEVEMFTPSQLTDAAEANRFSGTGTVRPFYDLSTHGQRVLPSQVPDSGTAGRVALAALLPGAGAGVDYAIPGDGNAGATAGTLGLGAIGTMAALNTRAGRKALEKTLLDRPQLLRDIGTFTVDRIAPALGMFGRGAAVTTAGLLGR